MVYELAGDVLQALQRRSVLFHNRTPIGDSVSRVMVDSFGLHAGLNALIFAPLHAVVFGTAMVVVLFTLDAGLTGAALLAAVAMTVASLVLGRAVRRTSREARDAQAELQSHLHHALSGIAVVQAFTQERRERLRFDDYVERIVQTQRRTTLVGQLHGLASGLPGAIGTAVVLWLAVGRVLDHQMGVGGLLVFMVYLGNLTGQVRVLANVNRAMQASRGLLDRVSEVLDGEPEIRQRTDARTLPAVRGRVTFEHVTLCYEPDRRALDDVSLDIRAGQTVALVGGSGAGKTTLVSLVARMLDPTAGRVLLDGYDLRDLDLRFLRRHVATVGQDAFLFPASISDNIAFGRPDATSEEIEAAARSANAHDFITALPQGYQTVLGERGGTLSGGQRQRVSIARAFLKDAPVLILDEPTSALDAQSERLLLQALQTLMRGRTTLIVAHRLSTIRDADTIAVLDAGRIVEVGSHDDLLATGGAFARLQALQRRRPRARPTVAGVRP
jgi:ABC-type multidrug transport system fused ATPase/permease subunit